MADSTRDMRRSVYERELKPKFGNQKLIEITHEDLRALKGVRALYNKAEYREQRTAMLQDWADMIDEWTLKPARS